MRPRTSPVLCALLEQRGQTSSLGVRRAALAEEGGRQPPPRRSSKAGVEQHGKMGVLQGRYRRLTHGFHPGPLCRR
jgi:hypothetical protein